MKIKELLAKGSETRKEKKRPKCPNAYDCRNCVHRKDHWDGIAFRGSSCLINAK